MSAETQLLACILSDEGVNTVPKCKAALLTPDMLSMRHAKIYKACLDLHAKGDAVDEISINSYDKSICLTTLVFDTVDNGDWIISQYIDQIIKKYREDQLDSHIGRASLLCEENRYEESLKHLRDGIEIYTGTGVDNDAKHISDISERTEQQIKDLLSGKPANPCYETPYDPMNKVIRGFEKKRVYVIGGTPGSGKSSLALNLTSFLSSTTNASTCFFSLEMPSDECCERMVSSRSGTPFKRIESGMLSESEQRECANAIKHIKESSLYINDKSGLSAQQIESALIRFKNKNPLDLVVIDHFHRMSFKTHGNQKRMDAMNEAAVLLKDIAKDMNFALILLVQLNRNSRNEARDPRKEDIKEASGVEENADTIMLLKDCGFYDEHDGVSESLIDPSIHKIKCIVDKQRKGPEDSFYLPFRKSCFKFLKTK